MRRMHIDGTLTATVPDAVTVRTSSRIHDAIVATKSWSATNIRNWENGIIEFADDSQFADAEDKSPLEFINRLNDMMWRVGITELGLQGEISVVVTGENPCVFRVIVENSEVTYQKAKLSWETPVKGE